VEGRKIALLYGCGNASALRGSLLIENYRRAFSRHFFVATILLI